MEYAQGGGNILITSAKAKSKASRIEHIKPTFCYKCLAPVFIKSIEVDHDWRVKLIPYDFYATSSRHHCSMRGVPIQLQVQTEAGSNKHEGIQ